MSKAVGVRVPRAAAAALSAVSYNPQGTRHVYTHLHEEAEHGEHGEAAVLELLHLELCRRVGGVGGGRSAGSELLSQPAGRR